MAIKYRTPLIDLLTSLKNRFYGGFFAYSKGFLNETSLATPFHFLDIYVIFWGRIILKGVLY
jgi:hypothetical protein